MQDVVIVAATRTAIGSFQGSLSDTSAVDLGATVIRSLLSSTSLNPELVDNVVMGQVLSAGCGQNPARQSAIKAGLPFTTSAMTLNKLCGSGLESVNLAAQAIQCKEADVVVAGGMESMSQSPYLLAKARSGLRMGHSQVEDSMLTDGLIDAFNDYHMGVTAENLAEKYQITREEQDAFAVISQ
mgnify:FL=1